ncbi:MAG TPA: hypothetical protein V6D50_14760 [Chroococcales cyanobacterium]
MRIAIDERTVTHWVSNTTAAHPNWSEVEISDTRKQFDRYLHYPNHDHRTRTQGKTSGAIWFICHLFWVSGNFNGQGTTGKGQMNGQRNP